MLYGQHVFVVDGEGNEHSQDGASEEGAILGQQRQQRGQEAVHVLGGGLIASAEAGLQLVLQLVEVAEVAAAIEGPAARPEGPGLPLQHLGVAEEGVEDLPDEDEGAQQEVGNANPQDAVAEALGQLQPLPPTFVLSLEAPFIEKQRARAPEEDQLEVVLEAASEEDSLPQAWQAEAQRQEGLVHQGDHVVLEAEDAVVDVQLGQLALVDADLVLLLSLHDARLHFLPRAVGEGGLRGGREGRQGRWACGPGLLLLTPQ